MSKKIIIDTDPGIDDAIAIMLAFSSPKLVVMAITTVCGNSTIKNTTRNAQYIVDLLKQYKTPIYSGATKPLKRDLIQAVIHGPNGMEGIKLNNIAKITNDAPEQIIKLIKQYPNQISIVAIGPLTNIAMVIKKDPTAILLVKELIIMGGAIDVAGNKSPVAEFNMFVDPEAANIVMSSPIKKILIPLDVCNKISIDINDLRLINNDLIKTNMKKMLVPYINNLYKETGNKVAIMYDSMAIYYLIAKNECKIRKINIRIEANNEKLKGQVIKQGPIGCINNNSVIDVVMDTDLGIFRKNFIIAMNGNKLQKGVL